MDFAALTNLEAVDNFYDAADALDLPRMMETFSDEIDLRIGNIEPVVGRKAVEAVFKDFWASLSGMQHERIELICGDAEIAQMSMVTYKRQDGKTATMPVATHLRRVADGRFDRLWIYIDIAPLFAE